MFYDHLITSQIAEVIKAESLPCLQSDICKIPNAV